MRGYLHPLRQHRAAGQRGGDGRLPVVQAVHRAAGRAVPRLHGAQAGQEPAGLRRPAAAVAGGAGRPGGWPGAARHVRRGPGGRVPGRQRRPGQHRAAAAAGRQAADLRGRRRPGHLRVPRRRPGAPAAAHRRLPGARHRAAGPQLPVPAGRSRPGQRHPPVDHPAWTSRCPATAGREWPRCSSAATTRPPRRGRSAPGYWRRTRTAPRCATRRCWSVPLTTATCWRSS